MNRLEKNLEILDKLYYYLKENPTIRFGQALSNLNLATHRGIVETEINLEGKSVNIPYFTDIFYEEPEQTLSKMRNINQEHTERAKAQDVFIEHITLEQLLTRFEDLLSKEEVKKLKEYELHKHTRTD